MQSEYFKVRLQLPLYVSEQHLSDAASRRKIYALSHSVLAPLIVASDTPKFIEVASEIATLCGTRTLASSTRWRDSRHSTLRASDSIGEEETRKVVGEGMRRR